MENNEKGSKEGKRLKLDLREALTISDDEDDDIIELKDEVKLPPKKENAEEELDLDYSSGQESPGDESNDEAIIGLEALDFELEESEDIIDQPDALTFEEEDEDEDVEDEEIQTERIEPPLRTDIPEEVVEVTEFDDILSEDDNEMITLAEDTEMLELEPAEEEQEQEEEFLELIDVDEDSFPEEEEEEKTVTIEDEIIQFDGLKDDIEDIELEDFINESISDEIQIEDDLEDDLESSLVVEAGSEMDMIDQASEAEDLDFNIDSREISEKIDQLDTIFFNDTESEDEMVSIDEETEEVESIRNAIDVEDEDEVIPIADDELPEHLAPKLGLAGFEDDDDGMEELIAEEDEIASDDEEIEEAPPITSDPHDAEDEDEEFRIRDDMPSGETIPQPGIAALDLDQDKIEESIERIIQQKYSEKIESMVVGVIEKAVSKEIDRLKNILLEDKDSESS